MVKLSTCVKLLEILLKFGRQNTHIKHRCPNKQVILIYGIFNSNTLIYIVLDNFIQLGEKSYPGGINRHCFDDFFLVRLEKRQKIQLFNLAIII